MKTTWFNSRQWDAICDVCGFKFKNTDLKLRWDGLRVCKDDWEKRHPQDFLRPMPPEKAPEWTRPDTPPVYIQVTNNAPFSCSIEEQYSNADMGSADCATADNFFRGGL